MKYRLNYDGNELNGVIFNDTYPNGALYTGSDLKPSLSFEYDSFLCDDQHADYVVILNGLQRPMTTTEKTAVLELAKNWKQPLGQDGNPTADQIQQRKDIDFAFYLQQTDWYVVRNTETGIAIPADITKKRQEARDGIVFDVDVPVGF
jgi:hypothetical protein